jgi:hypothetical protein
MKTFFDDAFDVFRTVLSKVLLLTSSIACLNYHFPLKLCILLYELL